MRVQIWMAVPRSFRNPLHTVPKCVPIATGRMRKGSLRLESVLHSMSADLTFLAQAQRPGRPGRRTTARTIAHGHLPASLRVPCEIKLDTDWIAYVHQLTFADRRRCVPYMAAACI